MIESLQEISVATSSWWRWMFWIPSARRIVRELVKALSDVPTHEKITRDRIHSLEVDLAAYRERCARMDILEVATEQALKDKQSAEGSEQRAVIGHAAAEERCKQLEALESAARTEKMTLEGQLLIRCEELKDARDKILQLEQQVTEQKEALSHVGRFIAASHRTTGRAKPGTIKELLQNAQRTN